MYQQQKIFLSEYHIDAKDRLIYVDETWREFAVQNAAPELAGEKILNKPLWDFISSKEVVHLYQMLLDRVRQTGEPIKIAYRCDAPHARRFFEMDLNPYNGSEIRFFNWLIHEEALERFKLLVLISDRSEEFLVVCSWCKRVKMDDQSWVEVEVAVEQLRLFGEIILPQLSHGICADCLKDFMKQIDGRRF
jgi:hypothetical protein